MDDVALKVDQPLSRTDGGQPGRIVFCGIFQQTDGIARYQVRPGRPGKGLIGDEMQGISSTARQPS